MENVHVINADGHVLETDAELEQHFDSDYGHSDAAAEKALLEKMKTKTDLPTARSSTSS